MTKVFGLVIIYMLTILLGYCLKRVGIFAEETKKNISNLIFYVTLPAMLISSFSDAEVNIWYLVSLILGMAVNVLMIVLAVLISRKKSSDLKGIYTINGAGFNMGNLAIPFLQNFYPTGISYLCMFDVGDSMFTLGTTYAIASIRMGKHVDSPIKYIAKSLLTTVAFDVYMLMTILALFHLKLPEGVMEYADFLGKGNSCLAMLLIGMSLEFRMSKKCLKETLTILGERYLAGILAAIIIFCFLPAPLVMRQILATAVFAATPTVTLIFTMRLGISTEIPGALAPISAVCMIPIMAVVMCIIGI